MKGGGRELGGGGSGIFSIEREEWGWKGGLSWDFFLPLTTNSLIGFPPVSSLNSALFSCWYRRIGNGPHNNLKCRSQLLFSLVNVVSCYGINKAIRVGVY